MRVAITGGIATGKSEAGRELERLGWAVCDTDDLARDVVRPGQPAYRRVVRAFGRSVLQPDGTLDRQKLGALVFADPVQREQLNRITHPAIRRACGIWLRRMAARGKPAAVMIPLLFEAGWEKGWDAILCVIAPRPETLARLRARGFSRREALARIRAQWSPGEKARRSDAVFDNGGTRSQLRTAVRRWAMTRQKNSVPRLRGPGK
jgi:dephospho-CoA kinase